MERLLWAMFPFCLARPVCTCGATRVHGRVLHGNLFSIALHDNGLFALHGGQPVLKTAVGP
jgi:hypothetical protein